MKQITRILLILILFHFGCQPKKNEIEKVTSKNDFSEVSELYTPSQTETVFSKSVSDTFKIFKSFPNGYDRDTASYPLILLLDANAYMASLVQELALARLTQGLPKCIIVGVGYKNFRAMDSLRSRDYTPVAYKEFAGFGGAVNFESFLSEELIPRLKKDCHVKNDKIILMGHSLGGTFPLHYLFNSLSKGQLSISNIISVSPPVEDDNFLLFEKEMQLNNMARDLPFRLYACRGSLDVDSTSARNQLLEFGKQVSSHSYPNAKIKFVEFGNFDHMDAAMPGFIKGLLYIFEE